MVKAGARAIRARACESGPPSDLMLSVTLNAEMTMQARRNPSLSTVIENADLVIPDGAGVVLYLRFILKQQVKTFFLVLN